MSKKIELHLSGDTQKQLTFLCQVFRQPARNVVAQLVTGAFDGTCAALKQQYGELGGQDHNDAGHGHQTPQEPASDSAQPGGVQA